MKLSEVKISLKVWYTAPEAYSTINYEVVKIINGYVIIKGNARVEETNKCGLIAIPLDTEKWVKCFKNFGVCRDFEVFDDYCYKLSPKTCMSLSVYYSYIQEMFHEIINVFKKCNCKQEMKLRDILFNEKVNFGRGCIEWDERSKEEREKENNEWLINNGFEDLVK